MSHNQFQFIGNLTRDTEVVHSDSGSQRAVFDIAVNRAWRNNAGEKQERTDFFRIKTFGANCEAHRKYLGKGSKVFVQGRIENTKYEKDGKTEYGTDFIAEEIEYLDTKAPGASNQE
ncbi:single-stranded DNA-binding protein [Escherichia coli]|nr:single-stranded DNA-binding protein [Escherichia coli]